MKPLDPIKTAESYALLSAAVVTLLEQRPGKALAFTKKEFEERELKVLSIDFTNLADGEEIFVIRVNGKADPSTYVPGVVYETRNTKEVKEKDNG